jgi:hypothetical protein
VSVAERKSQIKAWLMFDQFRSDLAIRDVRIPVLADSPLVAALEVGDSVCVSTINLAS